MLFPPIPYTPRIYREAETSLTVFYRWDGKARGDLAEAVQGQFDGLDQFFAAIEGPFSAAVERVEIRKAGALESVQTVPAQRDARIAWLAQEWPPKILGEVCGAIGFGLYDDGHLGKS